MKTPREILAERHRSMDAKLDLLRQEVVAEYVVAPDLATKRGRAPGFNAAAIAIKLWRELVLPCRRLWLGLGAAWLVIVTAHLAVSDAGNSREMAATKQVQSSPAIMAAIKEQKIWMIQMLEPATPPTASVIVPGPRSERRIELVMV
jgi:hypothetical protein